MLLRLEEIKFNHDTAHATTDAFNIRRNETEFVEPPEWRRARSVNPGDSPAAYALYETRGNTLTIQASFSCEGGVLDGVEVRALDARVCPANVEGSPPSAPAVPANVLGEVKAKAVGVCDGTTGFQTFELENVRIWDVGVGAQDIAWRWQFRHAAAPAWADFATTTHRIYTTLRVPTRPWLQDYARDNTQLPWAEVLDYACAWAAAARDANAAAELITRRVHALGLGLVRYRRSAHFTDENNFNCTSFLYLLRGAPGTNQRINCDDCAAVVSTFANSVGCDLFQSRIEATGLSLFKLKPHFRIGIPDRQLDREFFYHQVASEGNCRVGDEVFDACLRVDADGDPGTPEAILATNLRFGNAVGDGYRFRLVHPDEEPVCEPQEGRCKRRRLGQANSLFVPPQDLEALLEVHAAFLSRVPREGTASGVFISDFFFSERLLPGWRLVRLEESHGVVENPASQSYWVKGNVTLRADAYDGHVQGGARKGVLALLTRFQEPGMTPLPPSQLGDFAFADPEMETVLFAVGNMVFFLRNVGADSIPLMGWARYISDAVSNPPPSEPFVPGPPANAREFEFESGEATVGDRVRIKEYGEDSPARRRFYQFLAAKGEVLRQDGGLLYEPKFSGPHTLKIFAVDAGGDAVSQELHLEVR